MSLIVSRRPPDFGSVSSSKERRWMSIRCGTSRGLSRREKLLRVTGAALERAKVGDSSDGQRDVDTAQIWAGALKSARPGKITHGRAWLQVWLPEPDRRRGSNSRRVRPWPRPPPAQL